MSSPSPTRAPSPAFAPTGADATALLQLGDAALEAGRPAEARTAYERLFQIHPSGGLALRVAVACEAAEDVLGAGAWARQALALEPASAAHLCLGNALFASGLPTEAERSFRDALELDPGNVDALFRLGQCRLERQPGEARTLFARVTELAPDAAEGHAYLGHALAATEDFEGARSAFERALELRPDDASLHKHLGNTWMAENRYAEAEAAYRTATGLAPDDARHWNNLGAALRFGDRPRQALAAFQRSLQLAPGSAQSLSNVGHLLMDSGQPEQAQDLFRAALTALEEAADDTTKDAEARRARLEARLDLAGAQVCAHDLDAADANLLEVLEEQPDSGRALESLASVHLLRGDTETSLALYGRALALDPTLSSAQYRLAREGRLTDPAPLERQLDDPRRSALERMQLHFALGLIHERARSYAEAFRHFQAANALKPSRFDPAEFQATTRGIRSVFTAERIRARRLDTGSRHTGNGHTVNGPRPIFVVGMIRTGTTLVEQILSSHPEVHGAGERTTLQELLDRLPTFAGVEQPYPAGALDLSLEQLEELRDQYLAEIRADTPGAAFFTDKTPTHFAHLGLIAQLFPDAVVVHTQRDPRDACLSAYCLNFNGNNSPYAYDLDHLATFHAEYRALMAHWREHLPLTVLDVPYEELVADSETWTRRLLEHCGLPFDERCLRFHESERAVFTASTSQVRRPAHTGSIGKWRRYEPYLGDFPDRLLAS